jgi:uncharacterized membrane protein YecN with MAPEG domain
MTQEERQSGYTSAVRANIAAQTILPAAGFGLAYGIYYALSANSLGHDHKYDEKMKTIAEADTWWIYCAAIIFCRMTFFLNLYPMIHKACIMSGKAGNLRANPYIYKVLSMGMDQAVVMNEDGDVGRYNRANRSLHHNTEWVGNFIVCVVLTGYVFPKPVFVLSLAFCFGRIFHQVGYTNSYGSHGNGFGLMFLALIIMEGFLGVIMFRGLDII